MLKELQTLLHEEIPLTQSIGIDVTEYSDLALSLRAPLENNTNHKRTAFGGSLYSVAVLSGWSLLYMTLKQHQLSGHIVIHESNTRFLKPVDSDIIASCTFESKQQIDKFITMYQKKGKARIRLQSRIMCNNQEAVIFNGSYVVHN